MKTIVALATAPLNCAIHIIRMSGDDAFKIINKISSTKISKVGFSIQHTTILDNKSPIDDVLVMKYVAPKSYTGENIIEINCHGGLFIASKIIELLVKAGATYAKRGEFTQRALLNGKINFVIANAENATHGRSLSQAHYDELIKSGVNMITMGNHTWDTTEVFDVLNKNKKIIRPLNIDKATKESHYGVGTIVCNVTGKKVRISNLMSMQCSSRTTLTNPFVACETLLKTTKEPIHIIDFHAETTSEKNAFLMAFAGKVSAILGTHTHVQTADEKIYNNTAFITDAGMCGAKESIIGAKPDEIVNMFKGKSSRFHLEPAKGAYQFNSVIIEINDKTNKPVKIWRYNINNN